MKKQAQKQQDNETRKAPFETPGEIASTPINKGNLISQWGLPLFSFLLIGFLIIERSNEPLRHPWLTGYMYIDSSKKVSDSATKKMLFEKGVSMLTEQLYKHPYHGRIWGMYGHYMRGQEQWDSVIKAEKMALQLSGGASVNRIDELALMDLNFAISQKLQPIIKNRDSALQFIQSVEVPNYTNKNLHKFKGLIYANSGDFDSCKNNLTLYLKDYPNDFDALFGMSLIYAKQGMKQEAVEYFTKARQVNPNNPNLNNLANDINQSH